MARVGALVLQQAEALLGDAGGAQVDDGPVVADVGLDGDHVLDPEVLEDLGHLPLGDDRHRVLLDEVGGELGQLLVGRAGHERIHRAEPRWCASWPGANR